MLSAQLTRRKIHAVPILRRRLVRAHQQDVRCVPDGGCIDNKKQDMGHPNLGGTVHADVDGEQCSTEFG